jgi:glucose-6-phosphate isomerase
MSNITIGREWNKTLGHYHPIAENNLSYPELYQVLYGKATFLLQKKVNDEIIDFVIAEVKEGEAFLIPPNYGHVTINSGNKILVMANLVSSNFQSLYEEYIRHKGAAYYLLVDGSLIPNPNYKKIVRPRFSNKRFPISKDIYSDFLSCPSCFNFLNKPSLISDFSL